MAERKEFDDIIVGLRQALFVVFKIFFFHSRIKRSLV